MEHNFNKFLEDLRYTESQREDAIKKYQHVCSCVVEDFLNQTYSDDKKYLFGSYATKTCIRPILTTQDVDVLVKLPYSFYEKYEKTPSKLLSDIRLVLKDEFTTTEIIRVWGCIVHVQTADGYHNVQILPGLELENKKFLIPKTDNGGHWDVFDPRKQVEAFSESNTNSNGLTRDLVMMMKDWVRTHTSIKYPSFMVVGDVVSFVNANFATGRNSIPYGRIVSIFFSELCAHTPEHLTDFESQLTSARDKSLSAIELEAQGKLIQASEQWRWIFGNKFPKSDKDKESKVKTISTPAKPWCH